MLSDLSLLVLGQLELLVVHIIVVVNRLASLGVALLLTISFREHEGVVSGPGLWQVCSKTHLVLVGQLVHLISLLGVENV